MGDWDYWPEADELVWSDNLCALYGRVCVDRATPLRTFGDVMREADLDTVGNGLKSIVRTGKAESWDIVATLGDGRKSHRRHGARL